MTDADQRKRFNPKTELPGEAVLRKPGIDCTFYYKQRDDGELVERAVFDSGRVGDAYSAAPENVPSIHRDDVDVLPASAWPEPDDDGDTNIIVAADGGVVLDE